MARTPSSGVIGLGRSEPKVRAGNGQLAFLVGSCLALVAGSGIRTLGWLKTWKSDHDAAQQAQKLALEVIPLSTFTTKYEQPPALMLGFAGCNPTELRHGVSVLVTA